MFRLTVRLEWLNSNHEWEKPFEIELVAETIAPNYLPTIMQSVSDVARSKTDAKELSHAS